MDQRLKKSSEWTFAKVPDLTTSLRVSTSADTSKPCTINDILHMVQERHDEKSEEYDQTERRYDNWRMAKERLNTNPVVVSWHRVNEDIERMNKAWRRGKWTPALLEEKLIDIQVQIAITYLLFLEGSANESV